MKKTSNFSSLSKKEITELREYKPKNKIRFVTATALFDGHDASINIMRRLLQFRGAEVIHLGHNRSAMEIVTAAIQEDVQAVAISSYQGGHMELFKYVRELLDERGGKDIQIFGGGGGVIVPDEIKELQSSGITKIYDPEDGQLVGLEGIIGHMLMETDSLTKTWGKRKSDDRSKLGRAFTLLENGIFDVEKLSSEIASEKRFKNTPVLGITGPGGAGKSSLTDEVITRFLFDFPDIRIGVLCIDPSKKKTGGALLGDRIRINSADDERVYLRSFATRQSGKEVTDITTDAVKLLQSQDFDLVIVETSGTGQGDTGIIEISDISLYVMTCEFGAQTQLEKIDMLDFADLIAINKFERRQAQDALRDVRTQLRRTRFAGEYVEDDRFPIYGTIASRFNDDGTNGLYRAITQKINEKVDDREYKVPDARDYVFESTKRDALISDERQNYLADIAKAVRKYHGKADDQVEKVRLAESLARSAKHLVEEGSTDEAKLLLSKVDAIWTEIDPSLKKQLETWEQTVDAYNADEFKFSVRGRELHVSSSFESLARVKYPRVALPTTASKAEVSKFLIKENLPGHFPFVSGVFPFRREGEDPKRQFAGEGGPARTNKRFHYLCRNDDAKRLSTAFDSATLYGAEPHKRPDIYGKVGESGVSIATLDDMKVLYGGFDLCSPSTSVSMTINGPAPIALAMFMNTAIDQQVDRFEKENSRIPNPEEHQKLFIDTIRSVRGTVQADILKEDQAQNTCIFSTEFALKMMGDIQEYLIDNNVKNYYSVSISGYHIAEAGANPISQLAFTLANGFTYTEYYLSRGMKIDDFASNLSFFFSNGLDVEYTVIGRVARRIWAIAMRDLYGANSKSQKLKYHIQTSGRSLHAQEIDFNDIRTTLQALLALYDSCNSLHTNSYDEAITTPTEESVRRALAIQMIINKEFGLNKCQNVNQGSYFVDILTDRVEEAVLQEFESMSRRGGVLGSMETQYQRSKIQEESLYYEHLKHSGELPIVGVNTFLPETPEDHSEIELIRASYEEKDDQLKRLESFKDRNAGIKEEAIRKLSLAAIEGKNIFAELMRTVRFASMGEISEALYKVGGRYRRSM